MVSPVDLISVEHLNFTYRRGSEPSLIDVSLDVRAGEVLLIAGPSGCGKSTLLRCVNGLAPRTYRGDLSGITWRIMGGGRLWVPPYPF